MLAGAFVAFGVLQSVANAVLLGIQNFRGAALIGLVTGAVAVPATIAILAAGGGIAGIFAVEAAVAAANLALDGAARPPRACAACPRRSRPSPELRRSALRFAGWTTLSAAMSLIVWGRSEFLFLAHYSTDVEIGLYSIGFATVTALAALPQRLSTVLVSAFATLHGADASERIRLGFSRALRLMVIMVLPLTAGAAAVGPALLRVIYGDDYREAGTVLLILVGVIPCLAVASIAAR